MPAIQPIPQNTPDPAKQEAASLLAMHNRSTDGRKQQTRWNPPTRKGSVAGENSGTRKA